MDVQINAGHIAPCGMDCALCAAYQRAKKPCPGCNGPDEDKPRHCVKCAIFACEARKALADNRCTSCSAFPCRRLRQLDGRYRASYSMSMLDNLEFIHQKGMDAFLEFENERWHCDNCGAVLVVHNKVCPACGFSKRLV